MTLQAPDEARRHTAEPAGTVRVECRGPAVRVPQAQVEVTAVADRVRGRLRRECRAQVAPADSVLGLEGLEPDARVEQGRHAEIGERRDPAHRIEREWGRPAERAAGDGEFVLVRNPELEFRPGLQADQRPREEAPGAALPGRAVRLEAVAQHQVKRGVGAQRDPEPRLFVRCLPDLAHRAPRMVGDVLERRQRLTRRRPAETVRAAPLVLRDRHAAGTRQAHEVVPDQEYQLAARHVPVPSDQTAISFSSQV